VVLEESKCSAPVGIRTPDRLAVPTTLSQLLEYINAENNMNKGVYAVL
jgi:hypothetical protein